MAERAPLTDGRVRVGVDHIDPAFVTDGVPYDTLARIPRRGTRVPTSAGSCFLSRYRAGERVFIARFVEESLRHDTRDSNGSKTRSHTLAYAR